MNDFTFTDKGFSDYIYWQSQDRKTAKRINSLLADIKRNVAMQGIGKPELLKHRSGYSRRIDEKNRLVYDIDELQNIKIISCRGHVSDSRQQLLKSLVFTGLFYIRMKKPTVTNKHPVGFRQLSASYQCLDVNWV